jgi:hypothetical protein
VKTCKRSIRLVAVQGLVHLSHGLNSSLESTLHEVGECEMVCKAMDDFFRKEKIY